MKKTETRPYRFSAAPLILALALALPGWSQDSGGPPSILDDRALWNAADEKAQEAAARRVADRLGDAYSLARFRRFRCGELSHRLAVFRHEKSGVELHLVPGDKVRIGSKLYHLEGPPVEVRVPPFLIARTELTQKQWEAVSPGTNPSYFREDDRPVERVSWEQAGVWLSRAGGEMRLPSESEWEYAARAGTNTRFYWGDSLDPSYLWFGYERSEKRSHEAAEHAGKDNAFGLIDVAGNVGEWCQDPFVEGTAGLPRDGSPRVAKDTPLRVVRGGGWVDRADRCRSAARSWLRAKSSLASVGFRPARGLGKAP